MIILTETTNLPLFFAGTTALLKKLVSHFEETARAWRLSDVLAGVEYQNFTTSYGVARESTMPIYTMEEVVPTGCVLGTATPSGTTFVVHARGRACAMHCSPVQYEHIRRHCRGGESMESKYPHLYLVCDVPAVPPPISPCQNNVRGPHAKACYVFRRPVCWLQRLP